MGKVIGIDLGTTNSCVAVFDNGEVTVIPNPEGSRTTPSVVAYLRDGERRVGSIAKRQSVTNAESTIYAVKRLLGRRFEDEEAVKHKKVVPYLVVPSSTGDAWVMVGDQEISPQEVSSQILAQMRETAKSYLGEEIEGVVITVPAYFDDAQRQATKAAGEIAGLNVLRIINEPTAAALAYGFDHQASSKIAVYDLGGGTFDISILEIHDGVFKVLATTGDTHLGGEDFDGIIIEHLIAEFEKHNPTIDLRQDRTALQRLKEQAEKAKHELSSSLETEINVPFIAADSTGPKHLIVTLKRNQLEFMCSDLIERTLEPCNMALLDSGLQKSDIQEVILVGGMTRMPLIQKMVSEFFGRTPNKSVNPDEVVAIGAALSAASITKKTDEVILLDVTPLSIGVEVGGGIFHRLIPKNRAIPTRETEIFTTSLDNQPFVPVHVLQGEREMAKDNRSLAQFELAPIPPAPKGVPQIQVVFDMDAEGILHVSAKDLGSGKEQTIRVTASSGLTRDQIDQMIAESEQYKLADSKRKDLAELKVTAESLIYSSERAVLDCKDIVGAEILENVSQEIARLRASILEGDSISIRDNLQKLEQAAYKIAEAMYG